MYQNATSQLISQHPIIPFCPFLLADLLPQCHHPARLLPGTVRHDRRDLIVVTCCDPRLIGPGQGHEARRAFWNTRVVKATALRWHIWCTLGWIGIGFQLFSSVHLVLGKLWETAPVISQGPDIPHRHWVVAAPVPNTCQSRAEFIDATWMA